MKRILMRLAVGAVMAAMVLALAVPAFADTGGGGHTFPITGTGAPNYINFSDCVSSPTCDVTLQHAGPAPGSGILGSQNGLQTVNVSQNAGQPPTVTVNTRGGSGGPSGGSGGNCTTTGSVGGQPSTSGHGSAC